MTKFHLLNDGMKPERVLIGATIVLQATFSIINENHIIASSRDHLCQDMPSLLNVSNEVIHVRHE
jgi:hypothetical protein